MTAHPEPVSPAEVAETRLWEFADNFGADGFFEVGLIKALHSTARICEICFGADAADKGFDAMVGAHLRSSVDEGGWRHALEEEINGLYSELPIGTLFHDLEAYADYGISTRVAKTAEERETRIAGMIEQARDFFRLIPVDEWEIKADRITAIAGKAFARWRLDNGEPVDGDDLVALSGMAKQTIKNGLGRSEKPITGNWNRIEAREALAWLVTKGFRPSIWREQDDAGVIAAINEPLADVLFVPVGADGSLFTPALKRDGAYQVGGDGAEERLADFDAALAHLQTMSVPFWRRPTAGGVWTRVRGVDWRRVERRELETAPGDAPPVPA